MTAPLTCLRCGLTGPQVSMALVDLEAEARRDGGRVRTVEVEIRHEMRHVAEVTRVEAPERYGAEWRCRDRRACEERLDAWRRSQRPDAEEEVPPWIL